MGIEDLTSVDHEHRLAVVMNGGVSLAVWMGGVAYELDNVRRASSNIAMPDDASEAEKSVAELWKSACAARRVTLRVDVIAGTSAGGLNGILSACAIARGAPLTGLRQLWMTAAQLSTKCLMRPQAGGPLSLLDGGFFLDSIHDALSKMPENPQDARDVALTVTATSLGGKQRLIRDSAGQFFAEPDARRRYAFTRNSSPIEYDPTAADHFPKQSVQNEFTELSAISLAARASASYPGAFSAVREEDYLRAFRSWPDFETGDELEWLADGGILDNSPFEPVLRSIAAQTVTKPWQRTLCYVVPSGNEARLGQEIMPFKGAKGAEPLPPPWTSVAAAAFGLPRQADFRDDVEQIHELIRSGRSSYDVQRFLRLLEPTDEGATRFSADVSLASAALPYYRQARAAAGVYEVYNAVVGGMAEAYLDPEFECDPESVAGAAHPWLPDSFPTELSTSWRFGLAGADRVLRTMLRALRPTPDVDDYRNTIASAVGQCAAVQRVVTDRLRKTGPPHERMSSEWAAKLADELFTELAVPEVLADVVRHGATAFVAAIGEPGSDISESDISESDISKVVQAALCIEVINGAGGVPVDPTPHPIFNFIRMGIADLPDFLGTPAAAAAMQKAPSDILYGTRLHHFGAFGRPEWRAWDWMWGRLHAATHLSRLLGFSGEETKAILQAIISAEGRTPESVSAELDTVLLKMDTTELIDKLRRDGTAAAAVDSLFALLASPRETDPAIASAVKRAGRWAAVIGARTKPGQPSMIERLGRGATGWLRKKLWRQVNG